MYIAKSLSTHATDGLYWEEECLFLTCLFKLFNHIDNPHSEHFTIGKLLPFIFLRDILFYFKRGIVFSLLLNVYGFSVFITYIRIFDTNYFITYVFFILLMQ